MMKVLFGFVFVSASAFAYVPTVESLFRFGSNADVTSNGVAISMVVRRVAAETEGQENIVQGSKPEEFYRIFLNKVSGDLLKVSQARFTDSSFSDASLDHKIFYSNFTPHTMKAAEQTEKGLFYALLHSISYNTGSPVVSYLKDLGVPVKHNSELINRQKIEHLAQYKKYLNTSNGGRSKKGETNPLRPEDSAARDRVEGIMNESMYVDNGQVKLGRDEGQMAWVINAGAFESVVSYNQRSVQKYKYKSPAGEFSVMCKDYWLASGSHYFPKKFLIKAFNGENFEVDVIEVRHYIEKEEDLVRRQKRWDQAMKGKESVTPRPEFLL